MTQKNKFKKIIKILIPVCIWFLLFINLHASDKTGRTVRIVSLCFQNESLSIIESIIDKEGSKGTDIIILPETWRGQKKPEALDGETISALARLAEKHKTYILSPIDRKDGDIRLNSAVLIDRKGTVAGVYDKVYPYWSEFDLNPPVKPGINGNMVYDTDFGRIGMAICFDSNFPEIWQALKEKGAEIVFWSSAYSAGSQLQAYALIHHYYIVSSTYSKDCQVYDITGQKILDKISDDITVARIELDLDRRIYHYDFNTSRLDKLLKDHGSEIEKEISLSREEWFVLKAKKPGVSVRSLAGQYGLEELCDYQNRSRREINKMRGFIFGSK